MLLRLDRDSEDEDVEAVDEVRELCNESGLRTAANTKHIRRGAIQAAEDLNHVHQLSLAAVDDIESRLAESVTV